MFKTRSKLLCCVKVLAVAASIFLVGSCSATTRMYPGPERPASETALVGGATSEINIESCDGVKVTSTSVVSFARRPYHRDVLQWRNGVFQDNSFLKFTAEAGHTYRVDRRRCSYPTRCLV